MSDIYKQEFHVRWSDLDPNLHMRHTAYADMGAATRFTFLDSIGFTMEKFSELRVGPIIFTENVSYLSEVRPGDKVIVTVQISGLSEDGRKWQMFHQFFRKSDNKRAATISISGAWFDLLKRKVCLPPEVLRATMEKVPKTEDFKII